MRAPVTPRRIAALVVLLVGLALIGRYTLRLYSVPDQYGPFLRPARAFLNAAISLDSTQLTSLGATPSAVKWGLDAGRRAPELLQQLAAGLYVGHGMRNDNRIVVLFSAKGLAPCSSWPLKMFFDGPAEHPTIQDIVLECQSYTGPESRQ